MGIKVYPHDTVLIVQEITAGFSLMDKHFEAVNKRFEDMNKHFALLQ